MTDTDSLANVITIEREDGHLELELMGEGPLVLCLHGWSLDRHMWRPQAEALSGAYRFGLLDRRGFGKSSAPPGLSQEPADILAILDHLGEPDCILMGMSQGGRVALRMAHQYPSSVRALILVGAPLDGFLPGPTGGDQIPIGLYRSLAATGRLDDVKKHWASHPLMQPDLPAVREMLRNYEGRDLMASAGAAAGPLAGDLLSVAAPALVVTGELDIDWLQLVGDALAYGMPQASRAVVKGAGHLVTLTHAGRFNALFVEFLSRLATAGGLSASHSA